ncbi:MAG: hypothetical protein KDE09_20825 [Anaerolineales bacterium]|nr:hypothetical protein [Anaerolineales bacterium]
MPKELPLQAHLFTGELLDNRTPAQKRKAAHQALPQQGELFSQRDLAQFGVRAHPQLPLSSMTHLKLAIQDPRSPAEIEADERRAIEERTYPIPGIIDTGVEPGEGP